MQYGWERARFWRIGLYFVGLRVRIDAIRMGESKVVA